MQPSGNGDPSASVAPVGVGAGVVVTGALADEVGLVVDVGDVHDAATRALATMSKTARARMFRRYIAVGGDGSCYNAAMTSSGMSKFA